MSLKGILSIGGKPGLFKHIAQSKNAIIVEDLLSGKRMPAYATAKISALEDIQIYTDDEEAPLIEVFRTIQSKEAEGFAINTKTANNDEFKAKFSEVLPNYDQDRVYVSDMKKVFGWYNFLKENNLLDLTDEPEEETKEEKTEEVIEEKKTAVKAKPAAKKTAKPAAKKEVKETVEKE